MTDGQIINLTYSLQEFKESLFHCNSTISHENPSSKPLIIYAPNNVFVFL